MNHDTKKILHVLAGLYLILSLLYIGTDLWVGFKQNVIERSFSEGRRVTINELIAQAENEKCQPFSVFNEVKQVQVISVACLQGGEGEEGSEKKGQ